MGRGRMETGAGRWGSHPFMLSVMLSILRSKQVETDGQGRLDRLTPRTTKSFGFMQVIENNRKRE